MGKTPRRNDSGLEHLSAESRRLMRETGFRTPASSSFFALSFLYSLPAGFSLFLIISFSPCTLVSACFFGRLTQNMRWNLMHANAECPNGAYRVHMKETIDTHGCIQIDVSLSYFTAKVFQIPHDFPLSGIFMQDARNCQFWFGVDLLIEVHQEKNWKMATLPSDLLSDLNLRNKPLRHVLDLKLAARVINKSPSQSLFTTH